MLQYDNQLSMNTVTELFKTRQSGSVRMLITMLQVVGSGDFIPRNNLLQ